MHLLTLESAFATVGGGGFASKKLVCVSPWRLVDLNGCAGDSPLTYFPEISKVLDKRKQAALRHGKGEEDDI
jgi:hypothetical protein